MTEQNSEIKKWDDHYLNSDLSFNYKNNRERIIELIKIKHYIKKNQTINEHCLEILEAGLKHSWFEIYYELAGKILVEFYAHPDIQKLKDQLLKDKKYRVRENIFHVLLFQMNAAQNNGFAEKALNDKSIKIVSLGIEKILQEEKKQFLPALKIVASKFPKHPKIFTDAISFLEHGYLIEESDSHPGYFYIAVKYKNAYHYSQSYKKSEITPELIQENIARFKTDIFQ